MPTVLILDTPGFVDNYTDRLSFHGVNVISELPLRFRRNETVRALIQQGNTYEPRHELLEAIKKVTENGAVDFVIVGNNQGVGKEKASFIAMPLRAKTLVTYFTECWREPYRALGITRFEPRDTLLTYLDKLSDELKA